jgi:acyl dehydratase/NAD(P)-dependent dehydrogenase (short-subunit alcohol dehydrogenase family)
MTVSSALSSRRFTLEDQFEFAKISGDWNPIHVEPVAARRTIYGEVVVHGIHALLWALDCLARVCGPKGGLLHLNTKFKQHVHLNELISCKVVQLNERNFKLVLEAEGKTFMRTNGAFSQSRCGFTGLPQKIDATDCRDLMFEEIVMASGSLPLFIDTDLLRRMFPDVSALLADGQIAEILATTRLVGMECPGRHSIYLGHELHFADERKPDHRELDYQVTRADGRFFMLWLDVSGPTLSGKISAFARPRPRSQAAIEVVRSAVGHDEFTNSRALIIGGSRGLGEITAKIIAAGGGDVRITYHQGKEDAERVTQEIQSAGFKCSCLAFDALAYSESLALHLGSTWQPNQLYYFATPPISLERGEVFSAEKFDEYCRYFVNGFFLTITSVLRLGGRNLRVFYPSTVFLEQYQEHATEYCAAKAAGEILCRDLEKRFPHVRVHAPRLKRMATDQTSGLLPVETEDSLLTMLSVIRAMSRPE